VVIPLIRRENSNRQERAEVDELSGHCHGASGLRSGSVAKGMTKISYRGYRFPPEIIQQTIWLYLRFTLSFRGTPDRTRGLWPPNLPAWRNRCDRFDTQDGLIRNAAATTRIVSPEETRAIARSRRSFE